MIVDHAFQGYGDRCDVCFGPKADHLEKKEEAEMIDSTSDRRVENNVMRHEYRVLSEEEKGQMKALKDYGLMFIQYCEALPLHPSRELSLAKTKMEEAVMWAVKHVTR